MSYLKIIGEDTQYNVTVAPFTSQHGYRAVRFTGDAIPTTDKGFMYYADNGSLISDLSDFTHVYRPNEYTTKQDTIVMPKGSPNPVQPSAFDRLNAKVNELSSQVNTITPYTETKQAYIDDTEVEFDYRNGNISAFVADGKIPCNVIVEDEKIKVSFEALEEPATVTISIL